MTDLTKCKGNLPHYQEPSTAMIDCAGRYGGVSMKNERKERQELQLEEDN
jgi:hypothetical protein